HDVHAGTPPVTFQSRWAMSYLRGPLSREQIRSLTPVSTPAASVSPEPRSSPIDHRPSTIDRGSPASTASGGNASAPVPSPGIAQFFLPTTAANPHYLPVALGVARVTFAD